MWTADPNGHDNVFCRFVASNTEIHCDAAADQYLTDYPDVKNYQFPAWEHYKSYGKSEGRAWHSEFCNHCTQQEQSAETCEQNGAGGTHGSGFDNHLYCTSLPCAAPSCAQGKCTDKCRGIHDAIHATVRHTGTPKTPNQHTSLGILHELVKSNFNGGGGRRSSERQSRPPARAAQPTRTGTTCHTAATEARASWTSRTPPATLSRLS